MKIILFTTTRFRNDSEWARVRINLAHRLVKAAQKSGIEVVVLDDNSPIKDLLPMRRPHVMIVNQKAEDRITIGMIRRQALIEAESISDSPDDFLVWTEPEKYPIIDDILRLTQQMSREDSDLGMFNRRSLKSYPPEQAHAYSLPRLASKYFLKRDLDFMFGPVIFRRKISDYWKQYCGDYGDKWDSIHIPKLRAINASTKYSLIEANYRHPKEQTIAEAGDRELFMKRIEQADLICKAIIKEA